MASGEADEVLCDVEGRVATVTLNRPDRLNAMTPTMQQAYCRTLIGLDQDPAVRAIVITGAGRGFCAGADLALLDGIQDSSFGGGAGGARGAGGASNAGQATDLVDLAAPGLLSTPTIAAVNGPVAGMGFSYLLMADVRYVSATARIGSTFARLGLVAEWGSAQLLTRLVGSGSAADLLLSGRIIEADEALAMGLAQKVCAPDELLAAAHGWADDVAENCSPSSHRVMQSQLRAATWRDHFDESVELMLSSFSWPDLAEALAAKAEKRAPRFPGS